jgi:invasion protein IalB
MTMSYGVRVGEWVQNGVSPIVQPWKKKCVVKALDYLFCVCKHSVSNNEKNHLFVVVTINNVHNDLVAISTPVATAKDGDTDRHR